MIPLETEMSVKSQLCGFARGSPIAYNNWGVILE
jgi:hypothetical protein